MSPIESQLRFGFVHRLLVGPLCRARLVNLVHGYVLFSEQRLDPMQVIFAVCRLSPRSVQRSLRMGHIGLRLADRGLSPFDVGGRAAGCRSGSGHGVHLCLNPPLFIDNFALKGGLL